MYEGRELHITNLDWGATEKDVKQAFKVYGYVESVRIPRRVNGSSKGFGFIVFRDKEAATAALEMNLTMFRNRKLNVSISTNDKTAQTTLVTSTATSQRASDSPAPNHQDIPNGDTKTAASPTSATSLPNRDNSALRADIQSRTLALLNIPDTVNDARIRALCAPYGDLISVRLRPNHSGAIVEYKTVAAVGKAALSLEGHEIAPGRFLTIGSVAELNKATSEYRSDKIGDRPKTTNQQSLQSAIPIRRPGQLSSGPRRGGKGGLGLKRGGVGLSGDRAMSDGGAKKDGEINGAGEEGEADSSEAKVAKSNADFREMMLKK